MDRLYIGSHDTHNCLLNEKSRRTQTEVVVHTPETLIYTFVSICGHTRYSVLITARHKTNIMGYTVGIHNMGTCVPEACHKDMEQVITPHRYCGV